MNTQTETAKLQHNLKKNNTQVCFTFEFNEKHNIQEDVNMQECL